MKSLENKKDVMRILGSLSFYSTFINNLHMHSKPFYELLSDDVSNEGKREHKKLFQDIKDRIRAETFLVVLNPKHPFLIAVDS